jgi:membrane-associated HD superfamily phosphohydrolase
MNIWRRKLRLDKTQVMVYFSLYGDEFPIDDITEKLEVIPTETYKKGDLIPNRSTARYRKETSWDLGTDYQVSLDVNNQIQQIINNLQNKSSIINEIKEAYSLECKFFIVVKIEDGNTPALYLDKNIIKFAASIEAEFDIDLYANL